MTARLWLNINHFKKGVCAMTMNLQKYANNYNNVSDKRNLETGSEEWSNQEKKLQQNGENESVAAQQLKSIRSARLSNTQATTSSRLDRLQRKLGQEEDSIENAASIQDTGEIQAKFNIQEDIKSFALPRPVHNQSMERDNFESTARDIMEALGAIDHPDKDFLMSKANALLNEELMAKTIVMHYRNSLIFS
jgi:hypothetical protein